MFESFNPTNYRGIAYSSMLYHVPPCLQVKSDVCAEDLHCVHIVPLIIFLEVKTVPVLSLPRVHETCARPGTVTARSAKNMWHNDGEQARSRPWHTDRTATVQASMHRE
jgi:hypothetical protein